MNRSDATTEIFDRHLQILADARRLVETSRQHSGGIAAELSAARQRLAASRDLLRRRPPSTEWMAGPPDAGEGAAPEMLAADGEPGDSGRSFAVVAELISRVEQAAVRDADSVDDLIEQIKALLGTNTEPGRLIGILLEGIAQAIDQLVPAPERADTVAATLAMLLDRIGSVGGRLR